MKKLKLQAQAFDPTIMVLFGATGHLSANYLIPALHDLDARGDLPESLKIICVGRRDFTASGYLDFIVKKSRFLKEFSKGTVRKHFLRHLTYHRADFSDIQGFAGLEKLMRDHEGKSGLCYNRLYYFATSPDFFEPIANNLKQSGLLSSCTDHKRKVRVLTEKPFGSDLKSARKLNQVLHRYFAEQQIYRIDHYMGKETIQNLIVVRFANGIFEPLWNRDHIDHIEISVLEKDGVGGRGEYYDTAGALADVVQNHVLQILALTLMDEPAELKTELIRDQKLKILSALQLSGQQGNSIVRGQYQGYVKEIRKKSATETFVALKTKVSLPRWRGVPIYLRTGKTLSRKVAEISLHFKEPLKCLFQGCSANVLTLQIQPDEKVYLQINSKVKGFGIRLKQIGLEFGIKSMDREKPASAYDRLLLDFLQGDQRLFIRGDEIEAAWKFIDDVRLVMRKQPLVKYKAGSTGPVEAAKMIEKDGREWHTR